MRRNNLKLPRPPKLQRRRETSSLKLFLKPDSSKNYVIVVAGGSGARMGSAVPKQFLLLKGKPLLMHTLSLFEKSIREIKIILVLPESHISYWKKLCKKYSFSTSHQLTAGGKTRFHSVKNGLKLIGEQGTVAVHDGVRPFTSAQLIKTAFRTAKKKGSAVPAISPAESVRIITGSKSTGTDRSRFRLIQTPQCFSVPKLKKAYRRNFKKSFTDDATVFESAGFKVNLIEGERTNIKITTREDLLIASSLVR